MKLEKLSLAVFAAGMSLSSVMAYVRHHEELIRRGGLKGTQLLNDDHGSPIEYIYTPAATGPGAPIVILENGLGSPMESWDWVRYLLKGQVGVIQYHRRGYGRTKSAQRPAVIMDRILQEHDLKGPVVLAAHSIGALVSANALAESEELRSRTEALIILDGTNGVLLDEDRNTPGRIGTFKQTAMQEALASTLGVNRWAPSKLERDVEYRPDIQRAFLTTGARPSTQVAALREYLTESTANQRKVSSYEIRQFVVAAEDNITQQRELAEQLGASFSHVPASSHRSIIGKLQCAEVVASIIQQVANVKN
ncbi:pimeloyl-ACP methyl ester carboxylesterase [Paenarthrobacter nicotinovorans]|jgi:pimeloyl-ACP methyl ester carboxylesterase|uniref:Pimeloyl-ACP methyl ester carboxylesterase n=1 Tax=Paenarthrobacter nicotinovorans TaxID=29320 RepID=A0ABT9TN95_PAENI|nr:alpha/beta hydrolase [Paenarthrobacter nicotinovorans]MDQ0103116.1 pimeloyl-ACP methyl ester carboxylesterase [Paenarthrobacter nicotinovorans]GAT88444.1 hypothetical protein CVCC1112_3103 [Paenarthrobacter nicotinovorans]